MPESLYVALIGDIAGSRELQDRAETQHRLQEQIALVNGDLSASGAIAAPLALTQGDEIQALLRAPEAAVDIIVRLSDELFPLRIRHGLGLGGLSTAPGPPWEVGSLDGPAFHLAREAIESAWEGGHWVVTRGFGEVSDLAADALFGLMDAVRSGWTEKQAAYSRDARRMMQKDVAARHGVRPSVVSESLKASSHAAVIAGEQAARALLSSHAVQGSGE
ncbi:MAG: SatD family protein [Chloroflexota bacterium]